MASKRKQSPQSASAQPAKKPKTADVVRAAFRTYKDFPVKGVSFVDFTPALNDPAVGAQLIANLSNL